MATYTELYDLQNNDVLRNKIAVAIVVAADVIRAEAPATTNHANRLIWAKAALQNPQAEAVRMTWGVLAQNKALSVAQITGASDANILTAVQAAIDLFATGT